MVGTIETRRSFKGPDNETMFYITSPTAEDIRGADWQYSRIYTKCLNEGIVTSAEMNDILKRRGITGSDYTLRLKELQNNLNDCIIELNEAVGNEEKADLAVKVAEAREQLVQWNQRLTGPMSNTCEQISEDARLEYITSCIVVDESDGRVWKTHDEFLNVKDQSLSMKARYEVMLYLQGYDSNFFEQTPEAMAMKEIELDIMKEVDKTIDEGETVKASELSMEISSDTPTDSPLIKVEKEPEFKKEDNSPKKKSTKRKK